MNSPDRSIFEAIGELAANPGGLPGPLHSVPSVESSILWLEQQKLTRRATSMRVLSSRDPAMLQDRGDFGLLGLPAHRVGRSTKRQLDFLKRERASPEGSRRTPEHLDRLWRELQNPTAAVSMLAIDRMPADSLAFYRPFHWEPHGEWGIYMLVGPLLNYCRHLYSAFSAHLAAFTIETLLGCVLFEVFHHEFFHHTVECAATTIEIASAAFGRPRPIYANYWTGGYANEPGVGLHPDDPLEEALANSYAYNSFSFLSRTEIGHKLLCVKLYQKVLEKYWPTEPAGYQSAGKYINHEYVGGAAQLLAMLLSSRNVDPASLLLLAKRVMPNGNSAFLQKADVPTYFVGSASELRSLYGLVPAPSETYSSLLWLVDTSDVDRYLKDRKAKESKKKNGNDDSQSI
jgi:hypothetical protein